MSGDNGFRSRNWFGRSDLVGFANRSWMKNQDRRHLQTLL